MQARLRLAVTTALAVAVLAAPGGAQLGERYQGLQPPDLLELNGHVGKRFPHEPLGWSLRLGDGFTPTLYKFHLVNMRVINSGRLPGNILAAVEPYTPNFRLFGSPEQIALLAAATPEQPAKITGYRRLGSRDLMLTGIEVGPPAAATREGTPGP